MRGWITRGKTGVSVVSLLIASFLCFGQTTTPAQVSKNQTFTTHYSDYDALDFNPANLAANRLPARKVSFGLMESNFLLFNGVIKNDLMSGTNIARLGDLHHWFDDILVNRTHVQMDNTILGLNFYTKKAGSFGLSVKMNVQAEIQLKGALANLQFDGTNFTNLTDIITQSIQENPDSVTDDEKSVIKMNVINEFNLGYSRMLLNIGKVQLYGGVGVKYIMGFADMGLQFDNQQVAGYYSLSSLLPDAFANDNTIQQAQSAKKFSHGFGASLGASLRVKKFKTGVSVVDAGFINWPSKRIYITKQDAVAAVLTEDTIQQVVSNVIKDLQRNENGKEILPAKFVFGASYDVHKYVSFYLDFIAPLVQTTRSMTRPTIGAGTWLSLKDVITMKAGVTLLDKKLVAVPVYMSLFGGKNKRFEMSFGTSDLLTYFFKKREYLQAETAMMKFHF